MFRTLPLPVLLSFLLFGACSTGGRSETSGSADQNVIRLAEIQETDAQTAFQIVQQLRPRWTVRNRGSRSIMEDHADYPRVILDDLPPRDFDFLREIPRDSVLEIRFLSPREATFLFGTGYNAGAIRVTSRGRSPLDR